MQFDLYRADCRGNAGNCVYPIKVTITDALAMKEAAAFDHVCAEYKKNYRSNDNFLNSNVVVMDLDNELSEDPDEWITEDKLDGIMPDISYVLVPSRHHMKAKDGRVARPKYHVYFPVEKMTDADAYAALKHAIHRKWQFFDDNALDAARFVYGADSGDVIWHEGWVNISEEDLPGENGEDGENGDGYASGGSIPAGRRNNTMSRFASRVIKRYGNTDKAYQLFLKEAEKCDPPLPDPELDSIWASAGRFYKNKVQQSGGYVPPDEYNSDFEGESLRPDDYSDIGQAKVLSREYGDELVYTDASDYMRYDGIRWVESKQLAVGACEEFSDLQLQEAEDEVERAKAALEAGGVSKELISAGGKALEKAIDEKSRKAYAAYLAALAFRSFAMKRRDMKYITSALQAAKPMLLRDISEFDSDPFLLNTPSATYDLRVGIGGAREHRPDDRLTKVTNNDPGDDGMDIWMNALREFFCGDDDLIGYVQQIAGLAAIGKVFVEALIIAYGSGSNGKSTFWNTISRVLGDYSGTISADALTVGCKRNVKPEMAELRGKRLVIAAELEEGMRLSTSTVKQLCSTDEVGGEKKYKDPFKFVPSHTLVLYTNHLPKVGARDDGTWRRLIVIPFNAEIKGKKDIKNYSDYLVENAGSAVLKWIIEGAGKAIEADYKIPKPECVEDAIEQFQGSNDWLSIFLDECCEVDPSYTEKSGELYQEYRSFCTRTNDYTRSTTDFYTALEASGFNHRRTNTGRYIDGLRLKQDFLT